MQALERAGEVGVAVVLHGLLQGIGVHGQRVGAHAVQRIGQFGHHPSDNCASPMLPISRTSGASSRTSKLPAARSSPSMMRCDPSIMPIPSFCAASARFRLIVRDSSAPPVMAPTSTGACNVSPRNRVLRSTAPSPVWVNAL